MPVRSAAENTTTWHREYSLAAMATRLGRYVWTQKRLFEITGGWVQVTPEANVKLFLATASTKHAWHAELFERLIPEVPGFTPAEVVGPPNPAFAELLAAIANNDLAEQSIERLISMYRVIVPNTVGEYQRHIGAASIVCDQPIIRALSLALRDDEQTLHDAQTGLQSLVLGASNQVRAEKYRQDLEARLVAIGGIVGSLGTV
jgi:hypothetical protein